MMIEWKLTKIGECDKLEDVPAGAVVEAIDDKAVVARCEACGKWIFDGDLYAASEDADLCEACADDCFVRGDDPEPQRVSHEMALDAGDPELEGTEF
jgi:hypothetical protein